LASFAVAVARTNERFGDLVANPAAVTTTGDRELQRRRRRLTHVRTLIPTKPTLAGPEGSSAHGEG